MILILGGLTGGLGVPLHQSLCALMGDKQHVYAVGRKDCDVESEESISAFMSKIGQGFTAALGNYASALHIINATGVSISAMIHKADVMDINRTLRVNLVGNILLLKHARELYKQHGGTFTMIGSIAATDGIAGTAVYAASKAALNGLLKVSFKEMARLGTGTRVNVIELGYTNVGMISQVPDPNSLRIPFGLGTATDVAETCRYLIECQWITGASIKLNGGM